MAAISIAAQADVIHLKNGKSIVADSTHEVNGRVEYTVGENTFAIPLSLVERIDAGTPPSVPNSGQPATVEDIPRPPEVDQEAREFIAYIIHDGQVDAAALRDIEKRGNADLSAAANMAAANFEEKRNHLTEAARYFNNALSYIPDDTVVLEHYASVLVKLGKPAEAIPYAERATHSSPESPEAFAILGYAYYKNEQLREAIAAWKKSLALKKNSKVEELLARAERESKTEAEYREQQSSHFVLRYEGSEASDSLRNDILSVLEQHYSRLQSDLGAAPGNISVSLYTKQAFFDVTQAPAWSAAMNDGKLRIPVSGLTSMTPALARVLHHELTHSFTAYITHHHLPQWLDEGIAQLEEPRSASMFGPRLAALYASGRQVPLNQLESTFQSYGPDEALVAYAEALAAVECIRTNHGMANLAQLLQRLGDGESIEPALRSTIHGGYAQLESEITEYLKKNYGQ